MPVSSLGFFNELSQKPLVNIYPNSQETAKEWSNQVMQTMIHYKDLTDSDLSYIDNVNQDSLKKNNQVLFDLKKNNALTKAQKKQFYIESLLHNLEFLRKQAVYYEAYGKTEEYKALRNKGCDIREQIVNVLSNNYKKDQKAAELAVFDLEKYWSDFKNALAAFFSWENLKKILIAFFSPSNLLPLIGKLHLWRIAFVFARITAETSFTVLLTSDFFVDILTNHPNNYGGLDLSISQLVQVVNIFKIVCNSLSVALPALRLLGHLGLLIKHGLSATKEEEGLSVEMRLWREFKKRYYVLGNDIVWTGINTITNFNKICKISASNATIITAAFMFFDLLWMLPGWYLSYQEYQEQYQLLEDELLAIEDRVSPQYQKLLQNLLQLETQWKAKNDANLYSLLATSFFILGFTVATLVPAIAIAGYFVCNFAMAMNLAGSEFTAMREKKYALASPELHDRKERAILEKEYGMARNNLFITVAVYTIVPTFTMGLFAVRWPAAIPLIAAFIAFQILYPRWKASQQESITQMREAHHEELLEEVFAEPLQFT